MTRILTTLIFAVSLSANAQISGDVLSIGDSLTAGLAGSSRGVITCAALGGAVISAANQPSCRGNGLPNIGGWQPSLANLTNVNVFNFGNTGELSSQILARLDAAMSARSSQFVLILAGTNDAIRGPSVDVVASNLQSMINLVRARNRIPIIGTLPPLLFGRFRGSNDRVIQINQRILQFEDIEIVDHYAALVTNWPANTSGDFIHLGPLGNLIVSQGWAEAIEQSVAPATQETVPIAPIIFLTL